MVFTLIGRETDARPSQSLNASSPILLTPSGTVIAVSFGQLKNASSPIVFTLDGIVMLAIFLCPLSAISAMAVVPSLSVNCVTLLPQPRKTFPAYFILP